MFPLLKSFRQASNWLLVHVHRLFIAIDEYQELIDFQAFSDYMYIFTTPFREPKRRALYDLKLGL